MKLKKISKSFFGGGGEMSWEFGLVIFAGVAAIYLTKKLLEHAKDRYDAGVIASLESDAELREKVKNWFGWQ